MNAKEAVKLLLREKPFLDHRRGVRWLRTWYWAFRDPGNLTDAQWRKVANTERPIMVSIADVIEAHPPHRVRIPKLESVDKLLHAYARQPRVPLERATFHGEPAYVDVTPSSDTYKRAVYTRPDGEPVGANYEWADAFELLFPGSWEQRDCNRNGAMVRLDRQGRYAGALMPARLAFPQPPALSESRIADA